MRRGAAYFQGLQEHVGASWNRFWFTPSSGRDLCVLRIALGTVAVLWQLSFTADLQRWFGPNGTLDSGMIRQWAYSESTSGFSGRLSYLWAADPTLLWTLHFATTVVLVAFAVGLFTRVASVLSFVALLAYVHRAPFLGHAAEPVLTMAVGYLMLAPCGAHYSVDARRRRKKAGSGYQLTAANTISRHLIQVHLTVIYAAMFCTKLVGGIWWNGESLWWLAVQPMTWAFDPTFMRRFPLLLNILTYGVLLSELGMVVLVWSRWLRPLALAASATSWLVLAALTGTWPLSITMLAANLIFLGPELTWGIDPDLLRDRQPAGMGQ